MSKITSPILLDSTGQDINETLQDIHTVLLAANTLIDDESTRTDRVWSSQKIVNSFAYDEIVMGINTVQFESIASTPLEVISTITKAPAAVDVELMDQEGNTQELTYVVPVNGEYHWHSGLLIMEDGTEI